MLIPVPVLALLLFAFFMLSLGQDPSKRHGVFAAIAVVAALGVMFLDGESAGLLARLGRE